MSSSDRLAPPAGGTHGEASLSEWPKITLVTPVLNSARYLEETIQSLFSQGYPNLEYIVVDGGSTDGTVDIIRKYEGRLTWWVSEPDHGMYDALNKGFTRSSGGVMGWISATDMLHQGSLKVAGSVFRDLPQVEWITGLSTMFSDEGMAVAVARPHRWSRIRFLAGANQSIQQESTFWRRSLWDRAGGHVDGSLRMAGDFELWVRFFRHARLYSVNALVGGFRMHPDSLGFQTLQTCRQVQDGIVDAELNSVRGALALRVLRRVSAVAQRTPKVHYFWKQIVLQALYRFPGPDLAPFIELGDRGWVTCRSTRVHRVYAKEPALAKILLWRLKRWTGGKGNLGG